MLELVYFSPIHWDFIWQRPQSLALELARLGHRVLFVEPIRPLAKQIYFKQRVGVYERQDGITTIGPVPQLLGDMAPARIWGMEDALTRRVVSPTFRRMLSNDSVIIVGAPHWGGRVEWDDLPHKLICYDLMDFTEGMYSGSKARAIRQKEEALIQRSDLVFATHPALVQQVARHGKTAHLVPNGVTADKFVQATPPENAWVQKLRHPVVGYVGSVAKWLDYDLIRAAALRYPEWSFVIIGPRLRETPCRILRDLPNVHRMGPKSHDEIACYVRLFDVCIVPFKAGPVADHTDPVKVYEYLACGKPVVAANIPSLGNLGKLVYSVREREEFLSALHEAAKENDPAAISARVDFASANSWCARAQLMSGIISNTTDERAKN